MQRNRFQRIAVALIVLLLSAGVISIILDRREVVRILHAAGWGAPRFFFSYPFFHLSC